MHRKLAFTDSVAKSENHRKQQQIEPLRRLKPFTSQPKLREKHFSKQKKPLCVASLLTLYPLFQFWNVDSTLCTLSIIYIQWYTIDNVQTSTVLTLTYHSNGFAHRLEYAMRLNIHCTSNTTPFLLHQKCEIVYVPLSDRKLSLQQYET